MKNIYIISLCYLYISIFLYVTVYTGLSFYKKNKKRKKIYSRNINDNSLVFGEISNPTSIIILIHGTWARGGKWHEKGSSFLEKIKFYLNLDKDSNFIISRPQFRRFLWGGGNTLFDRSEGIKQLGFLLEKISSENLGVPIFIIAHSHGGNIALKTLSNNPILSEKVLGICCVSTPFLLHFNVNCESENYTKPHRYKIDKYTKIFGILAPLSFSMIVISLQNSFSLLEFLLLFAWIMGVTYFYTEWCDKKITQTTIHDEEIENELFNKVLPIRSAGDEASAALGAAYIIKYAITAPVRMINVWLDLKYHFIFETVEKMKKSKAEIIFSLKRLLPFAWIHLILFSLAAWQLGNITVLPWAFLSFAAIYALLIVASASFFVFRLLAYFFFIIFTIFRIIITLLLYSITGILLFPFAPELILSTSLVGISAEAALPRRGSTIGNIVQLAGDRRSLNHSAYDHKDIAKIISDWMTKKISDRNK